MLTIRKIKIEDYDEIYSLWLKCKGMGLNNLDDSYEGFSRFIERNPDTNFVSVFNGIITGVIMAGTDGRRAYVYHTAVHPDYRRRGIASALVREMLGAVEKIGINKASLVVFSRNAEGNEFWKNQGFNLRTDINYRDKVINEMERYDT